MTRTLSSAPHYPDLDPAIIWLCRELTRLPGITTTESCQGFVDGHRPGEPWFVHLKPAGTITPQGFAAIEFLVWAQAPARRAGFDLSITVNAPPPYLNGPGESLYFVLSCRNKHPDDLAAFVRKQVDELFMLP